MPQSSQGHKFILCIICDIHENSGISCSISYMCYVDLCDLINTCFRLP